MIKRKAFPCCLLALAFVAASWLNIGLTISSANADDDQKVDVFLGAGKLGRTVISIDDGVTWIHDHSDDDTARCWCEKDDPHYIECDHHPTSFTGLAVSDDGWFYAQYGWGTPGTIRRSRDAIHWEVVRTDGNGGGLAVANNVVVSLWNGRRWRSIDHGESWAEVKGDLNWKGHPFVKSVGNTLFAVGREDSQFKISIDAGETWKLLPDVNAGWSDSIVEGNGILVSTGNRRLKDQPEVACTARSTDGGQTWTGQELLPGQRWAANVIFNGQDFVNWSGGQQYRSKDGVEWTATPMTAGSFNVRHWGANVCFNDRTETYVAILNVWGNFYEKQKAYRSKDGVTWEELDSEHFSGGHPIGKIVLARVDAKAVQNASEEIDSAKVEVQKPERLSLWSGHAPNGEGTFEDGDAWLSLHRPEKPNGAAVVICPGGGYGGFVTGAEGHRIATWLNQ